ncbi:7617_t:CDS:2 [Funneliformis mosseae]|uniref:7617_t:CDS:1 n=1 Tax=Funneliformis mosseae TaxID=27381 RepID=A0A9N8ZJ71_FUNMO|nr:7617_t:CDS:2 [Funneliformis mosseae]
MKLYKLVVLGDRDTGKTSLAIQTYDPTIEDSNRKIAVIDDQPCVLEILDTAGQEEYTALRDQWIQSGDGFLLVYSISSRSTFDRVERYRDQITRIKGTDWVPLMLVGNNCHIITGREVSKDEGMNLARKFNCGFIESSGKTCVNVESAFYGVVRMIRGSHEKNRSSRAINCINRIRNQIFSCN